MVFVYDIGAYQRTLPSISASVHEVYCKTQGMGLVEVEIYPGQFVLCLRNEKIVPPHVPKMDLGTEPSQMRELPFLGFYVPTHRRWFLTFS